MNKKDLLDLGVVCENTYLDKYVELINNNLQRKREKYKTNQHHIKPKCYYRLRGLEVDNSKANKVYLLKKDHVLAHYYLYKCSIDLPFKQRNALMVKLNLEKFNLNINELDDLQTLYEDAMQLIGDLNRDKIYVYKEGYKAKMVAAEELESYLAQGYIQGNGRKSKYHTITNGQTDILVQNDELDSYIAQGYKLGHSHKTNQKMKGTYRTIHKGAEEKMVPEQELNIWLAQGYSLGQSLEHKATLVGKPNKFKGTKGLVKGGATGYKVLNNGVEHIKINGELVDEFLKEHPDYKLGDFKDTCTWVNDGKENIKIDYSLLEQYLVNGYKKGMTTNNRVHNKVRKKVMNIDTKEIFDSYTAANEAYGINTVQKACQG